jgi:hypothetical protein
VKSGAVISQCGRYRYSLWREWDKRAPQMLIIGLNPSTADAIDDDQTIKRCIGFAEREECGKLVILNLFAFRATEPRNMLAATDPIGPRNDAMLRSYSRDERTAFAVAAWGKQASAARVTKVLSIFPSLLCFGRNADRSPKHPLYLPRATPLVRYSV